MSGEECAEGGQNCPAFGLIDWSSRHGTVVKLTQIRSCFLWRDNASATRHHTERPGVYGFERMLQIECS